MAEIINLRQARKARERAAEEARAAENRIVFGRPKKAKTLQEKRKRLEESRHEGHRLDADDPEAMSTRPGAGIRKRSVMIAGHATSVSLEEPFWEALREIAGAQGRSLQGLIGAIDSERGAQNLSSAIRVFVLAAIREAPSR